MRWNGPNGFWASDEAALVDVAWVHDWLSNNAYWALGRPFDVVARSIANSLVLGVYSPEGRQVGFARFVTDRATFTWLCDVFVDPHDQHVGLGSFLVETAIGHPDVADTRIILAAAPERTLYRRQGFLTLPRPERWMEYRPMVTPTGVPGEASEPTR